MLHGLQAIDTGRGGGVISTSFVDMDEGSFNTISVPFA